MAKYYGKIGYVATVETAPGVWTEEIIERDYYGDINRYGSRWERGEGINDNVNINNEISILADPYAYQHFSEMRYVEFMGAQWKINSIQVEHPRLILQLGGLYNGQ